MATWATWDLVFEGERDEYVECRDRNREYRQNTHEL